MRLKNLVSDLLEVGLSEREIAELTGLSQSTLNRVRRGKESVMARTADAIRALHAERCGDDRSPSSFEAYSFASPGK